jgi:hypothetical protein
MKDKLFVAVCFAVFSTALVNANPLGDEKNLDLRGNTPLKDGVNAWFYGLNTSLGGNKYIGDVVDENSVFHNFKGDLVKLHKKENESIKNYENTHNHYQNLFVQTINKVENVNAVSVWGDSTSIVNGAKSWGGFFSARSACSAYVKGGPLQKYGSPSLVNCEGHDNQLIGIEIDVLNSSKPGVFPNMSKTGLQIVGFGNPNSMAVEVRSEDSDRVEPGKAPRGAFESVLYVKNSIQPEYGRMIVADFDKAKIGLDFRKPIFREGVMQFNTQGVGTGLVVNEGKSGEIYGGDRWPNFADKKGWLSARLGEGGFRVVSNNNKKELIAIDNAGGIYLNGDVYVNGKQIALTNPWLDWRFLSFGLVLTLLNLMIVRMSFSRRAQ